MLERLARQVRGLSGGMASLVNGTYRVLGAPGRLIQDFLNGVWLGHSLHAVLVDVVVGGATAALLLDVLRVVFGIGELETAATWVIGLSFLTALGAIVSGLTDYKDTAPKSSERDVAGLHGLLNIVATIGFLASLVLRLVDSHDAAFWLLLLSYLVVSVGSFIGGHVVFKYGYMVNHNAFSDTARAKEYKAVLPAASLAEATPTRAMLGETALVLVRRGDVVHALHEVCSHAGGPLAEGELKGDTITCPWHFSTIRLRDGAVLHGPAGTRQAAYRARINGDQVEVQGPRS
jgi:nitrite reductase/ring-hydroxylating ferredoxin subunit/uncharacterized membrane protein